LHVSDSEDILTLKFIAGLSLPIRREVEMFENPTLDKAFQRALAIERKVAPRARTPQFRSNPSTSVTPNTNPPARFPNTRPSNHQSNNFARQQWCPLHQTKSHGPSECRTLQNLKTNKTLLTELVPAVSTTEPEEVSLENPTQVDPSLTLMAHEESSAHPLFTHNCQIKNSLALLIMDNGSQKNLVSQELVNRLKLITTPHPQPYQLGWVQKEGPRILVSQRCLVTFAIGQFKDTVICDVSPLDCADLLLGLPYQSHRNAVYLAKNNQYKLTKDGRTYILTTPSPKASDKEQKMPHVQLTHCTSLCLVRPIPPDNTTHPVPERMANLLTEFADIFHTPTALPPHRHIDHSIDLIPGSSLPNAPTYRLAPTEATEMERQLTELINSGHIQPSSSPCASAAFVIPKRDSSEMRLVTDYRALNKATIKN